MRSAIVLALCLPLLLTGCSLTPTAAPTPDAGLAIHGTAHGAYGAISGGKVYLYAAGTGGIGTASKSLLNSNVLTNEPGYSGEDSNNNYYVVTDANGNFTISSDYTCTSGQQVYLYLVGGNSGGTGTNSGIGLMAVLGNCPAAGNFAGTTPWILIDEATTVAAAYSMAGYATDATHVATNSTAGTLSTLQQSGIQNAFANAANLASIAYGSALATTPGGNGTVPTTTINTLANILVSCINSSSPSSSPCNKLFSNALSGGATGTEPTDTATAAINIAHHPYVSSTVLAALWTLTTPQPYYKPALATPPTDYTIALNFTGGGLTGPGGIAIDNFGNVWIPNEHSVTELTSTGVPIAGSPITSGGIDLPQDLSIDSSDYVWVANYGSSSVTKLTNAGVAVTGSPFTGGGQSGTVVVALDVAGNAWLLGNSYSSVCELTSTGVGSAGSPFSGGGLDDPQNLAIDASGDIWLLNASSNSITKLTSTGAVVTGSPLTGGSMHTPVGIAFDSSGNAWVANFSGNTVSKFTNAGVAVSGSPYSGGDLDYPMGIAIDGSGNVWVANQEPWITELNSAGAVVSPSAGYTEGGLNTPYGIAIDGSGDVWIPNDSNNSVTEFIGAATPVVTPLVANLVAPYSAPASKP